MNFLAGLSYATLRKIAKERYAHFELKIGSL